MKRACFRKDVAQALAGIGRWNGTYLVSFAPCPASALVAGKSQLERPVQVLLVSRRIAD